MTSPLPPHLVSASFADTDPLAGRFTAVVLAADRGPDDPMTQAAAVPCKALTPVGGRPMILHVLDALEDAAEVSSIIVCGPRDRLLENNPQLRKRLGAARIRWSDPEASPSLSALAAMEQAGGTGPVLVTTADHPLLTAQMVDYFCRQARSSGCDAVAGVARHERVAAAFPDSRRTVTRLADGGLCGCNLFAFLTSRGRRAARFWRRVEQQRKNPLKVVRTLGWFAVLRYLTGRLTLEAALRRLSQAAGARVGVITLPWPEAAVDVDKAEDWRLVEAILKNPGHAPPAK